MKKTFILLFLLPNLLFAQKNEVSFYSYQAKYNQPICTQGAFDFINTTNTGIYSDFHWNFDVRAIPELYDGIAPPPISFPIPGSYTVKLSAFNTVLVRWDTLSQTIISYQVPDPDSVYKYDWTNGVSLCNGDSLLATTPFSKAICEWRFWPTSSNSIIISKSQSVIIHWAGVYGIYMYYVQGCLLAAGFSVKDISPRLALGDSIIDACQPLLLTAHVGNYDSTKYLWNNGETDSINAIVAPGTYWCTADNHGCMETDTVTVKCLYDYVKNYEQSSLDTSSYVTALYSIEGRRLWTGSIPVTKYLVNTLGYPPGLYFLSIKRGNAITRKKIFVLRN